MSQVMDNTQLHCAFGDFRVKRFPTQHPKSLRAWDAADEYLIDYVAEHFLADNRLRYQRLLIVNDLFGAVSVALHDWNITTIADGYVCAQALQLNRALNQISGSGPVFHYNLDELESAYQADAVLIKLPKDLEFFKAQLGILAQRLKPTTPVIAAGMVKHMEQSYSRALERYIGPCVATRAKKKARLLIAQHTEKAAQSFPQQKQYHCELSGLEMINYPNCFCYGQYDPGAKLFVKTMFELTTAGPGEPHIIDLGCGDGILGLSAATLLPNAGIVFIDNSNAAIRSAQASAVRNFTDTDRFEFSQADCLSNYRGQKADWILCNPPFHQEYTLSTHVARQMFKQARNNLRPGGSLWVVCNRHLAYRADLKRLFALVTQLGGNDKFLIYEAKCR